MTLLLLSAALAQDLGSWTKPEPDDLFALAPPRASCCGFDRTLWRRMLDPVLPDVRACSPAALDAELRLRVSLTFPANEDTVVVAIDTNDPILETCLDEALSAVRVPGGPLDCTFTVTWPVIYVPPREDDD